MSLQLLIRRKLRSAFTIPAATQRLTLCPPRQRLTLRVIEIIDSIVSRRQGPREPVADPGGAR
jgi:hypothetical protein